MEKINNDVLSAIEEERAALAREVHDNLGQELTTLRLAMRHFYREHSTGNRLPPVMTEEFRSLMAQVDRVISSTRKLAYSLRTDAVDIKGLASSTETLVNDMRERLSISGKLEVSARWQDPPDSLAVHMYRCLQELLNNIAKHSRAKRFIVRLGCTDKSFWLRVMDDGIGMPADVEERLSAQEHVGLKSLRERARLYGGDMLIKTRPEVSGTQIRMEFYLSSG